MENQLTEVSNAVQKRNRIKNIIIGVLSAFVICAVVIYILVFQYDEFSYYDDDGESSSYFYDTSCNVAGFNLHGELKTYTTDEELDQDFSSSEDIYFLLDDADRSDTIKAILFDIDTYGGSPVAAEEIFKKLQTIDKPVIALIRGAGLSAGYFVASGADTIFASALSDVGSIGVTMSYLDKAQFNKENGFTFNEISSGKFKTSGIEDKTLTDQEKAIFQRDVDIVFDHFLKSVAVGRNLDIEKVRVLADGSSMLGEMALENKLIDHIGNYDDVLTYIENKYAIEPEVCW